MGALYVQCIDNHIVFRLKQGSTEQMRDNKGTKARLVLAIFFIYKFSAGLR